MEIESSDVIATIALLATAVMWFRNYAFQSSIHKEQVQWQERQETQRQRERVEDRALREEETSAKINVSTSITTYRQVFAGASEETGAAVTMERVAELVIITVANWGQTEVKLSHSDLTLPDDTSLTLPYSSLVYPEGAGSLRPTTLPSGDSTTGSLLARRVAEELRSKGYTGTVEVRGTVVDALGRKWFSGTYPFDVNREYIDEQRRKE